MIVEILALLVPTMLLALVVIPRRLANAKNFTLRKVITAALVLQLTIAFASLFSLLGPPTLAALTADAASIEQIVDNLGHYDGISGLMFLLVSFLGVVVCRFSIRYLDGDPNQGVYFCWLGFTLGAVSLLVLAGNLVLMFLAWVMTSFGLHHLLMHFKDRPWARRAAWTKFTISRVGDLFLLTALILVYREFGSYRLVEIFAAAKQVVEPSWQLTLVGWFLMLGAATKSAQFPVHFWLPETMEAPTPVSALMHAGIVNAGGYLLVRLSPLVAHAPSAMATLAVIGGFTAVFAGIVMMTQTNIKRSLGYSTIAQMGFMMLQCGLGAFSAAMLHIIAHSLYKAHAFLRTGDAWRIEHTLPVAANASSNSKSPNFVVARQQILLAFGTLIAGGTLAILAGAFGINLTAKAGGVVLSAVICLALASWLTQACRVSWRAMAKTASAAALLMGSYLLSYSLVDGITGAQIPVINNAALLGIVGIATIVMFSALAVLQIALPESTRARWLQVLYVHASNGFYIDTMVRRALGLSLSHTPSAT